MTDKIIKVVGEVLETPVGMDTSQENCAKWDSLRHLNIIVAIEDAFDVSFEPEDIAQMKTVKEIEAFILSCH